MNPFYLLLPEDKPAISDINGTITYKELIREAVDIKNWLVSMGYKNGHRIGIAGNQSIRTYKYFLASQMLSSAVGLRLDHKGNDWNFKIPAANINVVLELRDEVIVHHKHFDKSTECPKEFAMYFSSGTTSNNYGRPQTTPMVWEVDDYNWGQSLEINHYCRALVNPYVRESSEQNIQIQAMQPWITWGQEMVTYNLLKQGHTILVDKLSEWDELVNKYKPTWTTLFPMIALKIIQANKGTNHKFKCVEMSGARPTNKQIEDFRTFFNCNYFISHYGTSQAGNIMYTSGDGSNLQHIGKPCEGFVHAFGEDFVRIGKNNTFEMKWPSCPPLLVKEDGYYDSNDVVEMGEDGNYQFLGRANEMLMIRGGSKFQAPSVEDRLLENLSIKEAYIFPIPDPSITDRGSLFQLPGCLYYGDLSPEEVNEIGREQLPPYMRPIKIFKLKDKLSEFTEENIWKVRRINMYDTIKENYNEWCEASYHQ